MAEARMSHAYDLTVAPWFEIHKLFFVVASALAGEKAEVTLQEPDSCHPYRAKELPVEDDSDSEAAQLEVAKLKRHLGQLGAVAANEELVKKLVERGW